MVDRAVKANDRAMKICKNDKDLIQQCHKLKKKHGNIMTLHINVCYVYRRQIHRSCDEINLDAP